MSDGIGFNGIAIAAAFLGGAVAGATAVLLLAPQSGAKTRKDVGTFVDNASDKVGRTPGALKDAYVAGSDASIASLRESYGNSHPTAG